MINTVMHTIDIFESIIEGQRINSLFDQYGGKVMPFSQLPREAQQSILEYTKEGRSPDEVKSKEYGLVNIPMETMVNHIMTHNDEISDSFDSWEKYHEWYMTKNDVTTHKRILPVTLSPYDDETLQDGWHRLHTYYHNGLKVVPAIMFV